MLFRQRGRDREGSPNRGGGEQLGEADVAWDSDVKVTLRARQRGEEGGRFIPLVDLAPF